jgi:hypothetical protein
MEKDKYINRNIGGLSKVYAFCDKHHLSKDGSGNLLSLAEITEDVLLTLALQNEFRRPVESDNYKKYRISYDSAVISMGYFSDDEINDIKTFNHVRVELI